MYYICSVRNMNVELKTKVMKYEIKLQKVTRRKILGRLENVISVITCIVEAGTLGEAFSKAFDEHPEADITRSIRWRQV